MDLSVMLDHLVAVGGNLLVLAAITGAVVMLVHEHRTAGLTRSDQEAGR